MKICLDIRQILRYTVFEKFCPITRQNVKNIEKEQIFIEGKQLKEYLFNVYKLEASLYQQKNAYDKLMREKGKLKAWQPKKHLEEWGSDINLTVSWAKGLGIGLGVGAGIFAAVWVVRIAYGIILDLSSIIFHENGTTSAYLSATNKAALILGLIGGAIVAIFIISEDIKDFNSVENHNQSILPKNAQIDRENEQMRKTKNQQIGIINKEINIVAKSYNETKAILDSYYALNIIFPKYRYLIAVSSFYEYFESGRCDRLEGHEGAYNQFENEIRLNMVICKLDEVIKHLDRIEQNQWMLYDAINQGNKKADRLLKSVNNAVNKLDDISHHAEITQYNSGVIAENTTLLKDLKMYEIMTK